jgi:hypothetical protein
VTKSSAGQDFADMEDAIVAAIAQLVRGAAPDAATQAKLIQRAVGIADEAFPGKHASRARGVAADRQCRWRSFAWTGRVLVVWGGRTGSTILATGERWSESGY